MGNYIPNIAADRNANGSFERAGDAAPPPHSPEPEIMPPSERHDGWTPTKQAAFLHALAATHNVSAAAREAGCSRQSAYKLRARLKGGPFDRAWDAAFECSFDRLAEAAMDRAINGVEQQHYYNGELVGTSRKYDERLTLAMLSMRCQPPVNQGFMVSSMRFDERDGFATTDFAALIERVEEGPERWLSADEMDDGDDDDEWSDDDPDNEWGDDDDDDDDDDNDETDRDNVEPSAE